MFRALLLTTFRSLDHHANKMRQIVDYSSTNSDKFSIEQNDLEGYLLWVLDNDHFCGPSTMWDFSL